MNQSRPLETSGEVQAPRLVHVRRSLHDLSIAAGWWHVVALQEGLILDEHSVVVFRHVLSVLQGGVCAVELVGDPAEQVVPVDVQVERPNDTNRARCCCFPNSHRPTAISARAQCEVARCQRPEVGRIKVGVLFIVLITVGFPRRKKGYIILAQRLIASVGNRISQSEQITIVEVTSGKGEDPPALLFPGWMCVVHGPDKVELMALRVVKFLYFFDKRLRNLEDRLCEPGKSVR
mmetsp:Transcript_44850/g.107189  ORF Transcript_44850/g.107189 Transcript_44850/m.107189 type:complete len:234 (+) Transcript_44850:2-703(+)